MIRTERHRSVQRLRGCWGPRGGHTQDRAGLQIPSVVTTGEHVSECFFKKKIQIKERTDPWTSRAELLSSAGVKVHQWQIQQLLWTICCTVSMNVSSSQCDSFSDLTCLPPICPMFPAHTSVNNILGAPRLLFSNNNMNSGQSVWKCGDSVLTVVPLQYKKSAWTVWNLGRPGLWFWTRSSSSSSSCAPNVECWLCKFWRI